MVRKKRRRRTRKKMRRQQFKIRKGLTKLEAFKEASSKAKRDFRGLSYDPESGKVTLI